MDLGGEHAPGVHAVAGQDAGGELLAYLRATQRAGGRGLGDQEHVHAQLAAHVEDLVERVDGRGDLRVSGLAGLLPVAGQLFHRRVDLFEEDQQPGADGFGVGVDAQFVGDPGAASAFHAERDELVVDVGDVGAVGDVVDAARPRVGDPLGVEDEDVRAVVEHLAGDAAQGRRFSSAGGGVDQDVRGFGVQVDGDDPSAGSEPDDRRGLLGLAHQLARLGVLEEGLRRGLAGFLHQHVRLTPGRVPGERHTLKGELLGDEARDQVAGEAQARGQVDAYLRVVVGEVLRNVEVAPRVGLLRDAERDGERLVQRLHPLAHQLPGARGSAPRTPRCPRSGRRPRRSRPAPARGAPSPGSPTAPGRSAR
jgi:hypothetical protein